MRKQILEFVQRPNYQAMKPKALAKKLGITKKKLPQFEAALAEAVAVGDVALLESGRVQAKRPVDTYIGVVRKVASGDAFVILQEPRPVHFQGDVFVDRGDLRDAQNGDQVLVKLTKRRRAAGQRCGFVVDIVERASNVFVGSYYEDDDAGWVQIDGKDFREPVWVGDPGAKGAREGDKVVVEMLRFPAHGQVGEAVLTKVLGPRGEPGVDTQMIIHEFGLPDEFPEAVLAEARVEAQNFREDDLEGREDLTGLTIVTIDPADARDFDDAISLQRLEKGHWELGVHIADVSSFVMPGTELDRSAMLRGNSVYLPTKVIPMLPEVISNGLASLQEGRLRYTMSAFIEYTGEGIPVATRFARSAIRVTKRFAYEEVLPIVHDKNGKVGGELPERVRKLLADMHHLAMILRNRRYDQGALELDMPEIRLTLDADGKVTGAYERGHDESHQIIEEFMLAANIAVAVQLNDQGFYFLRRVHGDPSEQKMRTFAEFAQILGYPIKNPQSRKELQKVLAQAQGRPEERSLNYALLRSLKQAEYSPVEMGHYALAEEHYCHFTSPIRRYPDLLIHRLLMSILTENRAVQGPGMEDQLRLGKHCSMTERRAERAERELIKLKLLAYMETRIGERMEAAITGVDRYGFFCRGIEIPAEGLVHVSSLPVHEHFEFDRAAMALVSRTSGMMLRLGDRVTVEVVHVDADRRELNLKLVTRSSGGSGKAAAKPPAKGQSKSSSGKSQGKGKNTGKRRRSKS